jgi:hypothetical protein
MAPFITQVLDSLVDHGFYLENPKNPRCPYPVFLCAFFCELGFRASVLEELGFLLISDWSKNE